MLFALDNRESYDHVDSWKDEFAEIIDAKDTTVMLVGCKMDLEDGRKVQKQEGMAKVKSTTWKEWCAFYAECSSLTGYNVCTIDCDALPRCCNKAEYEWNF